MPGPARPGSLLPRANPSITETHGHNLLLVTLSWLFPSPARASPGNAPHGQREGRLRAPDSQVTLQRVNNSFMTCLTPPKWGLVQLRLSCSPLGTDVIIKRCLSEMVSQAEHARHWEQHPNGGDVLPINNLILVPAVCFTCRGTLGAL